MRGLGVGVMIGAVAAGWLVVAGGCQLIAGVKDAVPYPPDGGTGSGGATTCAPGTTIACAYSGPMGTQDVGICRAGEQLCKADGTGDGVCSGEVTPKAESCAATEDENCDGYDCVQWAQLFGDTGEQVATSIAIDPIGNSFVGGYFSGVIPFGANTIKSTGATDGFLLKFDPAGKPLWGLSFGDANDPQSIDSIATDSDGNVLITGFSFSQINIGNAMLPKGPFVAKFDKEGKHVWSKAIVQTPCAIGSPGTARVAVKFPSDVIVVGSFCGTLDFGNGPLVSQGSNIANGFIVRLNGKDGSGKTSDGGWARTFGDGLNSQHVLDVATTPTGDIVFVGDFKGSLTLGSSYSSKGGSDIFVAQLTPVGDPTWTISLGGADDDSGVRIAVDKFGGPVILGSFANSISLGGNVIKSTGGTENGLVVKIATDKSIEWYKQIPVGAPFSAAFDGNDNILITGFFIGSLDLGAGSLNTTGTNIDLFLAKLTKGGSVVWNKHFEGSTQPLGILGAVAVNEANEPIMAGGTIIPIDFGTGLITPLSNADGFLVKFSP